TMARPVVTLASHATRASGSLARMASRMASEIWSASLSGWPSVTDSDVNSDGTTGGPPSNLPRRQGRTTACERPQAPGFSLWDDRILAQVYVVDPGVAEQLRTAIAEQLRGRGAR